MKNQHELCIGSLRSGGLITNYHCSSKCRHCLYASSPRRSKDYIDEETAMAVFKTVISLGCYSLHIGGGEPFLNPEGLKKVLITARRAGMLIEYVETNSSWFQDKNSAIRLFEELKTNSLNTLLVSISPFHNEFIPFYKVKEVINACNEVGISVFPWIYDFYGDIDRFPDDKPVPYSHYTEAYGVDYTKKLFRRYWIHPGGRALTALGEVYGRKNTALLIEDRTPCIELVNTSHFHFDLYGDYIPGLCSGIRIGMKDMGKPLSKEKYQFIHILYNHGIKGFYDEVVSTFGFIPKESYISKCDLCLDIRRFLVMEKHMDNIEFGPTGFYEEL